MVREERRHTKTGSQELRDRTILALERQPGMAEEQRSKLMVALGSMEVPGDFTTETTTTYLPGMGALIPPEEFEFSPPG
jgi:hypothetical protein